MNKKQKIESIINPDLCDIRDKVFDKNIPIKSDHTDDTSSFVNTLKEFFKRNATLYYYIVLIVSPVYLFSKARKKILKKYLDNDSVIVNVASGNMVLDPEVINLDYFAYSEVDIASDATKLCLKDQSVDLIINEVSLEHIYDYKKVVSETHRVLKTGGEAYFTVPFIQGFHASPYDYHRFTHESLKILFAKHGFKVKEVEVLGGPASSLVWILSEFFATLFSFGSTRLYEILSMVFLITLFPLKFLDFFLNRFEHSKNIACLFYIVVEK